MLCNTRGRGIRGQRDQGRSGLEAESWPCCRDVTKWDVCLQSRPFSQSGPIIQHVAKYLVNSVCLNFQETQPKGSRERQALATVESWDVSLHVSQRGCAGPSFSVSYLHFTFFYSRFCCIALQTGSIKRGLIELCFRVKAILSAKCFQMNLLHYVEHVCVQC